jgi:CDP-glycerol glycerophosphotransferase (TagB/SpsB family)
MQYSFSLKYKIARLEYQFGFYHNNELIIPSDLTLYYKFHLICYINDTIFSLPNIYNDSYYQCIELFNINDKIKFGIKIVHKNKYNSTYSFIISSSRIINYNNFKYNNDYIFDPLIINSHYRLLKQKLKDASEKNKSLAIKVSYIQQPKFRVKKASIKIYNFWIFINLYNYYFCLCKGKRCLNIDINQKCKYYFYLNIIEKNRFIYKKTDYLFGDFILSERSSDDTFPVFREMIKMKITAYYMTENLNIYGKYCNNNKYCKSIILVKTNLIDGDFLEKYLTIILKLKAAITGDHFFSIDNLFYNIDYITYICVGHGVAILKQFLYSNNSYYGYNIFNKILLPPSEKIINIAKKHGWKDQNIIKINLPRWDKYKLITSIENKDILYLNTKKIKKNSIFIMFTWRIVKKNKTISHLYMHNIFQLINDDKLNKALIKNNITLYFTLHYMVRQLKKTKSFIKNNNIEYIYDNDISEVLSYTNLVLTDFSSIIFDMICRKKPFIIFLPDAKDPKIKDIYDINYYRIIESFKNKLLNFENVYLDINKAINKIIYYINNGFKLEKNMEIFYKSFSFKYGENTKEFIKYLKQLK